ncbi:hypothetical protein DPMN_004708 [Dreissena polymorpha]|uniref:Uncharacterized protein n=1 Tax=Dreissena polymorpha TaxID=45954 RepID=A0A9D4RT80_DREPO|nr:hypothetical protein DPMN_004708 [Dreissena polymorpha]
MRQGASEYSNLIFGMHVYVMELHILSGERSRSSFKFQEEIQDRISNQLLKRYNNPKIYNEHMMMCLSKEASALLLSWLYYGVGLIKEYMSAADTGPYNEVLEYKL